MLLWERLNYITGRPFSHIVKFATVTQLLETTDLPLSEIARRAGFTSVAYFMRSFSATFGVTPSLAITEKNQASTPGPP